MEAVGFTASVVGILEVAAGIILSCNTYFRKVKDAPDDVRKISAEVGGVKLVVEKLQHLQRDGSGSDQDLQWLGASLNACKEELEALAKLLQVESNVSRKRNKGGRDCNVAARLAWPFKEGKAKDILERISHYRENLVLYWTINNR
jgi:hypothetical protein